MNPELLSVGQPDRAGLRDRVLMLRSQSIFEGLDDDGLLLLAEHGHSGNYRDGQLIAAEGEPGRSVYLVKSGEVVVTRAGRWLSTRKSGDAFGALPVLAREPSTMAVANGETETLEVPVAAFEAALAENFSLLHNSLRQLGQAVLALRGNLPVDPSAARSIDEGIYYDRPRSMVEQLLQLRASPLGTMNLEALVDLARFMVEVRYPAGELLWSVDDRSTHALHIDVGRVRCTRSDGKHVDVGRGFTIGVLDAWSHSRVYEARTEIPVIGFRIAFESFLALLEIHPEVGLDLLRGFARDLLDGSAAGPLRPQTSVP